MLVNRRLFSSEIPESCNCDTSSIHVSWRLTKTKLSQDINIGNVIYSYKIAKLLQSLGNKSTYLKEAYMERLNPFCEQNEARFNKVLNDICEVGDFYEDLEVNTIFIFRCNSMWLYLKKKLIVISL
jgi:hypothetical protein